jgi:DNA-directed RNA polymerase II subunit RPB7
MVFFKKQLVKDMSLHPKHFGPKIKETLRQKLIESVEGCSLGKCGYVILVVEVKDQDIGRGRIEPDTGRVVYRVKYTAILLRPFKNEIVDADVTVTTDLGFFCEVGPLTIFVTRHAMPEDLQSGYDPETQRWISDDKQVEIGKGCGVRLKIMGVTIKANEIHAIGTIKDDYLGLILPAEA